MQEKQKTIRQSTQRLPLRKGPRSGGAGVNDMPVACQSCAPECPQAFGAKRLRGLNVTTWTTSPSFASQMPPPLTQGRLSAAAGISPPVAFGDSPLLVEGAFERSHVSPGHDSAITLSYKTGAGCSKRSRTAPFCLLGQGLPERQTAFAGWCPVPKIEYAAFVANARPGFMTGHAFLFS